MILLISKYGGEKVVKYLSRAEAERLMLESNGSIEILKSKIRDDKYIQIRKNIIKKHFTILYREFGYRGDSQYVKGIASYKYDLLFGLALYEYLIEEFPVNNSKDSINLRLFSDSEFWIYLSVIVIPDIVSERWSLDNHNRFFGTRNRIWLFTIWWYIHLSWQGNADETYEILKGMSTDTILNLVDRTGRFGYNVELYREIMKEYSKVEVNQGYGMLFRKIMVTNQLWLETTEPSLHVNGVEAYVHDLFSEVGLKRDNDKYFLIEESQSYE